MMKIKFFALAALALALRADALNCAALQKF